jgi:hypothetical protein
MPLTNLNIGAAPNDGTGETLRSGGAKINTNYTFTVTTDTAQTITGAKTFSAAVTRPLEVSRNVDGGVFFRVSNPNTGSSARASVEVSSDNANGEISATSSTNVISSLGGRGSTFAIRTLSGDTSGGIAIMARNAAGIITLHSGGNTERMRIASDGKITASAGTHWVGTVAQSASSAVVERGSNANGEFVRFADGTQICTRLDVTATRATTTRCNVTATMPAAFVAQPAGFVTFATGLSLEDQATGNTYTASDLNQSALYLRSGSNTTWFNARVQNNTTTPFDVGDTVQIDLTAIGRWY